MPPPSPVPVPVPVPLFSYMFMLLEFARAESKLNGGTRRWFQPEQVLDRLSGGELSANAFEVELLELFRVHRQRIATRGRVRERLRRERGRMFRAQSQVGERIRNTDGAT